MRFSTIIYFLTVLCVIVDLLLINVVFEPHTQELLTHFGFSPRRHDQSMVHFIWGVLFFSFFTAFMLIVSFMLLIKKVLFSSPRQEFFKNLKD